MKFKKHIRKIQKFLTEDIWILELNQLSRLKKAMLKQTRLFYIVTKDFFDDRCQLRSAALAFRTLLSIVPFFALVFAAAKSLGLGKNFVSVILEKIVPGQEEVIKNILSYIENTNVGALGYIGFIFLAFIVVGMFSTMEETFNDIWGVKRGRDFFKRLFGYLSLLVIMPLLFIVVATFNTILAVNVSHISAQDIWIVKFTVNNWHMIFAYLITCFAFTGIYKFMPNTKVNFSAAFLGGVIAGSIWHVVQWAYINFQMGVSRYNVIYGAFAALPVFLMWLYVSWVILLLGAEVAFAYQNERNYAEAKVSENISFRLKEKLALNLMYLMTVNAQKNKPLQTAAELANTLRAPVRLVREIIFILKKKNLLIELSKDKKSFLYRPALSPEKITVGDVLCALKSYGTEYIKIDENVSCKAIDDILAEKNFLFSSSRLNLNFRDLLNPALYKNYGVKENRDSK